MKVRVIGVLCIAALFGALPGTLAAGSQQQPAPGPRPSTPATPPGQQPATAPAPGGQKQPPAAPTTQKPAPQAPAGQPASTPPPTATRTAQAAAAKQGVAVPAGYRIGIEDMLSVIFWNEEKMSTEAVVRPDGRISIPLLNDVQAAGQTPEELAASITKTASKLITDPEVTVIVREIKSRKVYVSGQVAKTGSIPLQGDMTVWQALIEAGGPLEWAKKNDIRIVRDGKTINFRLGDVERGRNLEQNIKLQPGDTIFVP